MNRPDDRRRRRASDRWRTISAGTPRPRTPTDTDRSGSAEPPDARGPAPSVAPNTPAVRASANDGEGPRSVPAHRSGYLRRGLALLATLLALWAALAGLASLQAGERLAVDQILSNLAMPLGMLWSLLIALSVQHLVRGRFASSVLLLAIAITLSVAGSWQISSWATSQLERQTDAWVRPLPERLDAIVLLGGGTFVSARGEPQLAPAGDRLFEALQQFRAGRTDRLILTGEASPDHVRGPLAAPGRSARALLISVGVPDQQITLLGGRTTSGEIAEIKQFLSQVPGDWQWSMPPKLGVITSATHLPRAMRLARAAGLDLYPIPCDYRGGPWRWQVRDLVPDARAANQLHAVLHECFAGLVGR